jgi:hypothetical protein
MAAFAADAPARAVAATKLKTALRIFTLQAFSPASPGGEGAAV